eukprot:TRINITY_DN42194_c0_g1_i1.p1 TRINITY_DN42194_c0_g1~~TRINITY_DN42194_c0_g1_i1.p1  ORF type:complete len:519 (-),score=53.01 TRINITY_DN42194_c0_g1_i1:91-1647(-)
MASSNDPSLRTWECLVCGDINKGSRPSCNTCGAGQPIWTCASCGEENKETRNACNCCKALRADQIHGSNSSNNVSDLWSCPACGEDNGKTRLTCNGCEAVRPASKTAHGIYPDAVPKASSFVSSGAALRHWICRICGETNHRLVDDCNSCTRVGRAPVTTEAVSSACASAGLAARHWRCGMCQVTNHRLLDTCISCKSSRRQSQNEQLSGTPLLPLLAKPRPTQPPPLPKARPKACPPAPKRSRQDSPPSTPDACVRSTEGAESELFPLETPEKGVGGTSLPRKSTWSHGEHRGHCAEARSHEGHRDWKDWYFECGDGQGDRSQNSPSNSSWGHDDYRRNCARCTRRVKLHEIRFAQDSVGWAFSDGRALEETLQKLQDMSLHVQDLPMIRVVEGTECFWSLDNRRLWVMQAAFPKTEHPDLMIDVEMLDMGDAAVRREFRSKFTTGQVARRRKAGKTNAQNAKVMRGARGRGGRVGVGRVGCGRSPNSRSPPPRRRDCRSPPRRRDSRSPAPRRGHG